MEKSLIICTNERLTASRTSCALRGSREMAERIERYIKHEKLDVVVQRLQCLGHCNDGPVLRLLPGGDFLLGIDEQTIMERLRVFAAQEARLTSET